MTRKDMDMTEELANCLHGYAVLTQSCANALLQEPDEDVLEQVRQVADAMGMPVRILGGKDEADPRTLRQRYYDRLIVTSTPYFVPLTESAITGRLPMDGRVRYGSYASARADHVARCYKVVDFDIRDLEGYAPILATLKPDSMAAELTFIARLAQSASQLVREKAMGSDAADDPMAFSPTADGDTAAQKTTAQREGDAEPLADRVVTLLADFTRRHTGWFADAADCLAATDDDLYATVARLAAEGTAGMRAYLAQA